MTFRHTLPGQYGGGQAGDYLIPCGTHLNRIMKENINTEYFKTIQELCIILRVSGPITDFKGDGPELLRYQKKSRYIKIELVIPESKWRDRSPEFVKDNYIKGIRECFYLLVERAEKENEIIDKENLVNDFERAMTIFENEKTETRK